MSISKLKEIRNLSNKKISASFVLIVLVITLPVLNNNLSSAQQQTAGELNNDTLIVMVNLERIRTQLLLTEKNLNDGNKDMAFAHAFIPHSITFPSIKSQLIDINKQFATELEARLIDLPFNIKSGKDSIL